MSSYRSLANELSKRVIPSIAVAAAALAPTSAAGTWTPLAHDAPGIVNLMVLLSDGTVMCSNSSGYLFSTSWFRLTPDVHGSYVNGTWSVLANSHDKRLFFPSQVLRDGRVFIAGGEYGPGGPNAELYDPVANVWTQINPPSTLWNPGSNSFFDCNSEILPDGRVLTMPVFPNTPGMSLLYDPATNTWSNGGLLAHGTFEDEASWVKLPDQSILTIDPFGTQSERYIPSIASWVADSNVPVSLYDPFGSELGGALLLPNGNAFFLGATGHTAIYTGSGSASPGTWIAGPDIPGGHGTPDAPAAMMVDGKVLCAVSPLPSGSNHFPPPTSFCEYDWVTNTFSPVGAPLGPTLSGPTMDCLLLDLPDGSVLLSHYSAKLFTYTPSGAPLAQAKPTIASITPNADGSFHLVGTSLNGISEGASYGDDFQVNTNFPLVRLSDGNGAIRYARTFDWSIAGVQTGSMLVSTEFRVPESVPTGSYSLAVVANGVASDPVPFTPTCGPLTTYCTAKLNSQFCAPTIGFNGGPSASNSTTFHITASQLINNKVGLLFYSHQSSAAPFEGGVLCCKLPITRTPLQSSGGSASGVDCSGTYDFDFNAWIQSGLDPNLGASSIVYAQYWSRDPQDFSGFTTSLTDALTFAVCP